MYLGLISVWGNVNEAVSKTYCYSFEAFRHKSFAFFAPQREKNLNYKKKGIYFPIGTTTCQATKIIWSCSKDLVDRCSKINIGQDTF